MPVQEFNEKVKTAIKKKDLKIGIHLSEGIVREIITQPEIVGDSRKRIKAGEDNPRVVIENSHTHKQTEGEKEPEGKKSDNEPQDPNYDPTKENVEDDDF
ncbi:37344_t:CDS:2 [Gigaspora margarita]|uniref:37344_t:CDS:1 n=1 Tax=Gigaspora margarita TaxID=4874 RepID=A0ABN7US61_GIGMA|nr:37344_t:CDS:2 [Gigaspora margarita]